MTPMTYKQFKSWCLDRTCDGRWSATVAMMCIKIVQEMDKVPFWKRKKAWEKHRTLATVIVAKIEEQIADVKGSDTNE